MDISQERRSGAAVFTISGRLDSEASPQLDAALAAVPADARVVLDLAQLTYVSSAGLRVLVSLVKRLAPAGGRLAICSLTPAVRQILNITGLTGAFDVQPSIDSAVARVTGD